MMRRVSRVMGAALLVTLGAACDRERSSVANVRLASVEEQAKRGRLTFADSQTVKALRAPNVPGRIVYDPPEDLSIANAMRTRPDLVKADTSTRDTSLTRTHRDTTGGDATADTSGGAARRRRR